MSVFERKCEELARQDGAWAFAKELTSHFQKFSLQLRHRAAVHYTMKPACSGVAVIDGDLNLSHEDVRTRVSATCSLEVSENWANFGPSLRCTAPWIRGQDVRDPDWHVNSDGSLCYVLGDQWRDAINYARQNIALSEVDSYAAFYAVNSAKWLLFRHLESYRMGITRWSDHWPAWPHHEAGRRAYRQWRENRK